MIGAVGIVLVIIAAILKLVAKDPGAIIWLIIIGAILIGIEATFGWYRGGRTYRSV